jgi:hypothetical protein
MALRQPVTEHLSTRTLSGLVLGSVFGDNALPLEDASRKTAQNAARIIIDPNVLAITRRVRYHQIDVCDPKEYVRLETADEHRTVTLARRLLLSNRHGALLLVRSYVAGGPRTLPGSSPR